MKKYEALELEIISIGTDVVLASFGGTAADTPFVSFDPTSNPLRDLGFIG